LGYDIDERKHQAIVSLTTELWRGHSSLDLESARIGKVLLKGFLNLSEKPPTIKGHGSIIVYRDDDEVKVNRGEGRKRSLAPCAAR
jgi:hypothetical protein